MHAAALEGDKDNATHRINLIGKEFQILKTMTSIPLRLPLSNFCPHYYVATSQRLNHALHPLFYSS